MKKYILPEDYAFVEQNLDLDNLDNFKLKGEKDLI